MAKLALIFPGQGAQYVGMGLDFPNHPVLLDLAFQETGLNIQQAITSGEGLNETLYTQLSVFLTSVLALEVVESLKPRYEGLTGFSLGEYSGLYAAGVISLNDAIRLIHQRSLFMQAETLKSLGFMAAILGLSATEVDAALSKITTGKVVCANYNSPIQTVISGEEQAFVEAEQLLKAAGAKRVIKLAVSGAFHSPLMKPAGESLLNYLSQVTLQNPSVPVYLNTTAQPLVIEALKTEMSKQVYSSVRFQQTIEHMASDGFTHFLEIGPGQVLGPLVKKINPTLETFSFGKYNELENLKGWLQTHGFIQ
jgi:[acyl-carrier-protein] S-malonyltransferase